MPAGLPESKLGAKIVDPAGEYYDDYYAVFFLDPDGLKLEGMKWGERTRAAGENAQQKKASRSRQKRRAAVTAGYELPACGRMVMAPLVSI